MRTAKCTKCGATQPIVCRMTVNKSFYRDKPLHIALCRKCEFKFADFMGRLGNCDYKEKGNADNKESAC